MEDKIGMRASQKEPLKLHSVEKRERKQTFSSV